MASTEIEWTDATWNPVAGCAIISPGCSNCYAMQMAGRLEAMGVEKYAGLTRMSGGRRVWTGKVREDHAALDIPFRWRKGRKIFVNSMSDLFHEDVSVEFIREVWRVMRETPQHQYQILTKRPERMKFYLRSGVLPEAPPNVWLGTSVEAAEQAYRIDHLRDTPAVIRFVSFEPLIGAIGPMNLRGIHWAIVGGESGPGARPMRREWIDEIHEHCRTWGAAFFFKQWGAFGEDGQRRAKKENGRAYHGRQWDEMPTPKVVPSLEGVT
jgi:protein gp37